jgi:hypothetical protein
VGAASFHPPRPAASRGMHPAALARTEGIRVSLSWWARGELGGASLEGADRSHRVAGATPTGGSRMTALELVRPEGAIDGLD